MNYQECIEYIENIPRFSVKKGIENIERLLNRMGRPDRHLKVIHVAGTNGKGSVCAYTSSILVEAGFQVGLFTSPHLSKYNERIQINNKAISDEEFVISFNRVKEGCDKLAFEGFGHPTFFEFIFAMAVVYFYTKNVDFVVLETGLGGRLDATNVIEKPLISVITSISLDHMEILGETLEKIATEKAGIIKEGCPVVAYCRKNETKDVFYTIADEKKAPIFSLSEIEYKILNIEHKGIDFSLNTRYYKYDSVQTSMLGHYQIINIAITLLLFEVLYKNGLRIHRIHLLEGIKKTRWPGRMELIKPNLLLDGAHNEEGIGEFVKTMKEFFPNRPLTLLFGCVQDKPFESMIDKLCKELHFDHMIITEPNTPRAATVERVYETMKQFSQKKVFLERDNGQALKLSVQLVQDDGLICCVGSLYLIGSIRKYIEEEGYYD